MNIVKINDWAEPEYAKREAFNTLRTNIQFSGINLKTFLITSCGPNEGKSTITFELARSIAASGKKVVLVDGDIRKSVLISRYKIERVGKRIAGLSHYLAGMATLQSVLCATNIPGMDIILAGPSVPNPTELLGGERFEELLVELKNEYDVILVDSPPLGSVIDAAIMTPQCDGTILVMYAGETNGRIAREVTKQLEVAGSNILGVVLNAVKVDKSTYGKYYGRYE